MFVLKHLVDAMMLLKTSRLWKKLKQNDLSHKSDFKVVGKDIQADLLGDSSYPLGVGILKCLSSNRKGIKWENLFDKKYRAGRVKIENTFGL